MKRLLVIAAAVAFTSSVFAQSAPAVQTAKPADKKEAASPAEKKEAVPVKHSAKKHSPKKAAEKKAATTAPEHK